MNSLTSSSSDVPTIDPPQHLKQFKHPNLKFLSLGRYISGIAGEKDKVICVVKPKLVVAAIRGTLSQEMTLSTIASIHYQDVAPPSSQMSPVPNSLQNSRETSPNIQYHNLPMTDVVVTDLDGNTLSFSMPKKHLEQFVSVVKHYSPPETAVHQITGAVSLIESLAGLKRSSSQGVMSSLISFLQHSGQKDREAQVEKTRQFVLQDDKHQIASVSSLMLDNSPMEDSVVELLADVDYDALSSGLSPDIRGEQSRVGVTSKSVDLPKPHPSSSLSPKRGEVRQHIATEYPRALEKLQLGTDPTGRLPREKALPGDDASTWKEFTFPSLDRNTDANPRPVFGEGGTIVFKKSRNGEGEEAKLRESAAIQSAIKEVQQMHIEIERLKAETENQRWERNASATKTTRGEVTIDSDVDTDVEADVPSARAAAAPKHATTTSLMLSGEALPKKTADVKENTEGSLLPLLSASTQQAVLRSIEELADMQRILEVEVGRKHLNPSVFRQLQAMKDPLRTLHRLVAPNANRASIQSAVARGGSAPMEFVPVWALVDFGEVNYANTPLSLKQYHRLIVKKIDDEMQPNLMIATRQQFAVDEGYHLIPYSSVLQVSRGAQPRPIRAQRLLMDGTITRSDEFMNIQSCLSLQTRLQHILIQFEDVADCDVWLQQLQDAVIRGSGMSPDALSSVSGTEVSTSATPFKQTPISADDI